MPEYKITGVSIRVLPCTPIQIAFGGFRLKGVIGAVNPFVDGDFTPLDFEPTDIDYLKKELAWAEQQVGKTLVCDGLSYRAFATNGPVTIKE